MVLKRKYKFYSRVLKRTECGSFTAAAASNQLTAREAEAGLVAAEVLAARWWLGRGDLWMLVTL